MGYSGFKDSIFLFLKSMGIHTAYSRRLETEKKLYLIFSGTAGIKCRPLDKDHQHIQVIQVHDAADVYNFFRMLCRNTPVRYTYGKGGKAEYISGRLTLETFYPCRNKEYISRLLLPSHYRSDGIKAIWFKAI